ncbi:hypothetical protein PV377_18945 [Streptomyces ipomoeae]|uniref:hypothetical protein n=1 Tax=Streptomyces ipomoeae TaxID=103232 RepID=UPI0029BEFA62|nr:hypothetical protein [Streptomyces ipomoeae]MDX2841024.1 hypothetical protein [Streptomyces ipomoeae]
MSDGTASAADELDGEAARRRRGRDPGGSRTAGRRPTSPQERAAAREAERLERQRLKDEAAAAQEAAAQKAAQEAAAQAAVREAGQVAATQEGPEERRGNKRPRPKAIPFYPDPGDEDFLWQVTEAGAARQERIPHTAVLRLALRRLAEEMKPSDVVRELGGPVQSTGKRGRPRK